MAELTTLLAAALLGVVEGLTEFLPVSSTGHLILAEELLGVPSERDKTFLIFIQLGAILAVVWERRATLAVWRAASQRVWTLVFAAFLPTAAVGLLLHRTVKEHLFSGTVVAWSLLLGAVAIWLVEARPPAAQTEEFGEMSLRQAFLVGVIQCLSLVPGVSRAAATILGAMLLGLSRPLATEFSFLLAIPTIGAATTLDLFRSRQALDAGDVPFFATGFVVSFLVALLVVRWLVGFVRHHDFRPFAIWRALVGGAVLLSGVSPRP